MNAHELNQRLCDRIDVVLELLFPAGKKVRGEFCIGSLSGEAGDSLKVHLGGAKKGYWADFSTNERGRSLLGLWAETLNGDYARACVEAKKFLGVSDNYERSLRHPVRLERKEPAAVDRARLRPLVTDGEVSRYLIDERKIDPAALVVYRVAESSDGGSMVFLFCAVEQAEEGVKVSDKAAFVKFIKVQRDEKGKKEIWTQPAGVTDCLFGKGVKMPPTAPKGVLVITEGEIDALSVATYGYHGVSVPRGAKAATADGKSANDQWIEADYDWLANFERIYLWLDNDEPGLLAARDIAQRIGLERCFIVTTPAPYKDANECLVAGIPPEDIAKAFDEAITLDPANLIWASAYQEKVFLRLFPPGGVEPGREFLWPFPWKLRNGEMTVWTGFSGHGKTVMLNQLSVHLADQGDRVCVASMEVEPDKTLETLWCQANGGRMPFSYDEGSELDDKQREVLGAERFGPRYDWLADRFLIFVPEVDGTGVGRADWRKMLECFVYARQRYGCTVFLVDSLMMCVGRSEQEYQQVELLVNALSAFSKRHQVHVHLVAHSRKKEDELKPPGKQDIAGPKETADIAHNVAVVHRNEKKRQRWRILDRELTQLRAVKSGSPQHATELQLEITEKEKELLAVKAWHDGELHLLKQRNGDGELGSKYLFFLTGARQFVQGNPWAQTRTPDSRPHRYIPVEEPPAMPTNQELSTTE